MKPGRVLTALTGAALVIAGGNVLTAHGIGWAATPAGSAVMQSSGVTVTDTDVVLDAGTVSRIEWTVAQPLDPGSVSAVATAGRTEAQCAVESTTISCAFTSRPAVSDLGPVTLTVVPS